MAVTSLKRNLEWLFLVIFVIGSAWLAWGLYSQWRGIIEGHQLRQNSQITTIGNATRAVFNSQETLLTLLGGQLMVHWRMGQVDAVQTVFENMLEHNRTTVGYALLDEDLDPVVVRWRDDRVQPVTPRDRAAERSVCETARDSGIMVVGGAFRLESMDRWLIPACKAMRDTGGEVTGFVSAALAIDGPDSFFAEQAALGQSNVVQVIRGADLSSMLWATALELPEGYLAQPISRRIYEQAIASAERLSGAPIDTIRATGRPYPYRLETALGPQVGMAMYDDRYDLWVLTQTNRRELLADFFLSAWIYVAIYLVVLTSVLALLFAIGRAERRRRADLVYQAHHDMLTGLPNRQSAIADFERMRHRYGDEFALMFIDMDNFKAVNDGFGHMQGDAVLRLLGARLNEFAREEERVARVGGDEFVLLTPETDPERLVARGCKLADRLAARYVVDDVGFELGCSIGIARPGDAGPSLNDLLRAADVAMYSAKRDQHSARLYEPTMGRVYLENIQIEQRLRKAVDDGAIHMVYQPQVDPEGRILGVEALARWDDPELGEVGPSRFIAIAETSGLIGRLGDHILECCLADARRIANQRTTPLRWSLNISVRQFLQPDFAERVIERMSEIDRSTIEPVLEITENLFAEDYGSLASGVGKLHRAGIRIALDDFGTGFSSLAMLRDLTIDELKIDKSFIDDLEAHESARKLVQSILAIGRNQGMRVVAEGVETRRQFEILREDGCEVFQGFLFSSAMTMESLIDALTRGLPGRD
ncbi:MAG: EAL domain-containing protein [Gammaproteobacteria bacterium]|nr:EAL domain-containing protein [Gammaproteobacteria bacterium]